MGSDTLGTIVLIILFLPIFFLPTIIAVSRQHHYKWVIFAINLLGMFGISYVIAFVWAVWPRQTAIFDVITNDPTTNSPDAGKKIYRQMGENVGEFKKARDAIATADKFCTQCGHKLHLSSRFCQNCGAQSTP